MAITVKDAAGNDVTLKSSVDGADNVVHHNIDSIAAGSNNIGDVDVASIAAGNNNIGDVDVASIAAGENVVGKVGMDDTTITISPTCDTAAYAAGDLIFDAVEIANAARVNGGSVTINNITVHDAADQKAPMYLVFLNANTDMGTANSAPNPDDTEQLTVLGHVTVDTDKYLDLGANSIATVPVNLQFKAGASTTSLWVAAINGTNTPTYAANSLVFDIALSRS